MIINKNNQFFKKITNKNKCSKIYFLIIFLLSQLCSLTITDAIAKSKKFNNYQIELIIFKNNNTADIYKETWPLAKLTIPENNIALTASSNNLNTDNLETNNTNNNYSLLPASELKYNAIYNKIKNNRRYTAISHIGWLQSKKEMSKDKPIYFTVGNIYNNSEPEVTGLVRFTVKKFVHTDLNLLLNLPVINNASYPSQFEIVKNTDNNSVYKLQSILLSENRRLKSNELNYFDNPAFSAVMIVSEV